MKRSQFLLLLLILTNTIYAQTLDTTIGIAAGGLSGSLPGGSTIVMIEFETSSEELANHVIDEMNHNLVTLGLIRPVERRRLNTIRSELSLNTQGEVSDDFAQRIGQMLGAQYIILGSISSIGNQYIVRFRAITTETATIQWSFSQNITSDTVLASFLIGSGKSSSVQVATGGATQAPVASESVIYRIGDTGPAGGIIFYDRGNNSDGWRYLEAASRDAGNVAWMVNGTVLNGTRVEIGTGKQNTQTIINFMMDTGGSTPAAMVCRQFNQEGFNDWFLPSKTELNLMYWNL